MHMKRILLIASIAALLASCTGKRADEGSKAPSYDDLKLYSDAIGLFGILPDNADTSTNPVTPAKVELGKLLYYDTRLSLTGNNSCNSCHNLATFGVDNEATSEGDAGERGGRNSPTTLNAAFHSFQFWDGRAKDVEEQAGGPILNPVEMHMPDKAAVEQKLASISYYPELFKKAFPGSAAPLTYQNLQYAIGAFERTLVTPAPFDRFLQGDDHALTPEAKLGLQTFISTGCASCHSGALLGGNSFQKFGVFHDYRTLCTKSGGKDNGLADLNKNPEDKDKFKVPSLRNIEKTWPYFHDGSVQDLEEAVAIMAKAQLNKDLSSTEVSHIVEFLKSLTGEVPADAKVAPAVLGEHAVLAKDRKAPAAKS